MNTESSTPSSDTGNAGPNEAKLREAFRTALLIDADQVSEALEYNSIKEWDSVGHMALIAEIETEFDVMLGTDEVVGMSSFRVAKEILARHGVEF